MTHSAIVMGVGALEGLGAAVARRLAREGLAVTIVGRTLERLNMVAQAIEAAGGLVHSFIADATVPEQVAAAFSATAGTGKVAVAVFNAGGNRPRPLIETDPVFFEEMWRVGCFAGHLFALEAIRHMEPNGRGSVLFTGASASLRGKAGFAAFASAKAGLRAITQTMAREYGPKGLHVVHFVIDGGIDGERVNTRFPDAKAQRPADGLLNLTSIAETYWQTHLQHRSAWSHEVDLRPYCEQF